MAYPQPVAHPGAVTALDGARATSSGSGSADHDQVLALLERALPGSAPATIRRLAQTADVQRLRPDDMMFRQGEPVRLTLVIRGYGAYRRTTIEGQQVMTGIAAPGDLIGLTSISATRSSIDLMALTMCDAAIWTGPQIRELVAADPGFALDVIDKLASFLTILTMKVDGFLHQDARRRVVRILARHRDVFFADPPVVSRAILPGLVGTSREMTGRVLRELEREQTVLRVGRTGLRLLRPDQLDVEDARI
jgi:CRP/FNR family cyclic AMP-dependent transcriptional regulator